jgi:hypothetical protein
VQIVPSKSEVEPLIQVADLLTAMAAFSRTHIETYRRWKERESGRENLLEKEEQPLTVGEREKCAVLSGFRDRASPHPHIAVQPKTDPPRKAEICCQLLGARLGIVVTKGQHSNVFCDVVSLASSRVHNLRQLVFRADLILRQEDSLWRSLTSPRGLIVVVFLAALINTKPSLQPCRVSQAQEAT